MYENWIIPAGAEVVVRTEKDIIAGQSLASQASITVDGYPFPLQPFRAEPTSQGDVIALLFRTAGKTRTAR
jgi:hypothetical protein